MVAPVLVHLRELIELGLKIIHRFLAVLLGGGVELHVVRRFAGVGGDDRLGLRAAFGLGLLLLEFTGGGFFEQRVLLHLLLDERLQFQRRRLEQRQRLLELRSQHLGQRHLLR